MDYDYCVVGGGIVGLATAIALLRLRPGSTLLVLEKEEALGQHQTGHNSNVIHSGAYNKPGSLKATLCRQGAIDMKAFCSEQNVPFATPGKLRVASTPQERAKLDGLLQRVRANGVEAELIDEAELRRLEPNICGLGAILTPTTGIVDYVRVCVAMGEVIRAAGGDIRLRTAVIGISEGADSVVISSAGERWRAKRLIVCAGLQSDRLALLAGVPIAYRIVPLRGEYYRLPPSRSGMVHHLIYPMPHEGAPGVGIHLTPTVDGRVTVGPNAVLGFSREGYPKLSFNADDVVAYLCHPGFWRFIGRNWKTAALELAKSVRRKSFLNEARVYCPTLELDDLQPYRAGIRAHAVRPDGTGIDDFMFSETPRMLHVCNAPSPAASSSLPIGRLIAEKVTREPTT